jgi:hypothetical protein
MPVLDAFAVVCKIRENPRLAQLPVVAATPQKTFPFWKLQVSPTSSHRDQGSTRGVHGPSLLASALGETTEARYTMQFG